MQRTLFISAVWMAATLTTPVLSINLNEIPSAEFCNKVKQCNESNADSAKEISEPASAPAAPKI